MAYGLTWTGLSETLVAGRGAAGSPLSRKGLLRLTGTHNPRGDSSNLLASSQLGARTLVVDRSSGVPPRATDLLWGYDAMRRRRGFREMKIDPTILPAELTVSWLTTFLIGTELFVFSPLLPKLAINYNVSPSTAR